MAERLLQSKVALVTGSAQNIGRAIVMALAEGGATVAVNTRQSKKDAQETVDLIQRVGGRASLFVADVTSEADVATMISAIAEEFGGIDILVNNAVSRRHTDLLDISLKE